MNALASPLQITAGWHGATDIITLIGLPGTYSWGENPLRAAMINFRFDPGREGFQGTYTIIDSLGMREDGVFYCAPNNPIIGWAYIHLFPNGGGMPRLSLISGLYMDAMAKIWILVLGAPGPNGPTLPMFTANRYY